MARRVGASSPTTRALVCIAHDPGLRVRDIAVEVGISERSARGLVADLVDDGYVVKVKAGRRNRYRVRGHSSHFRDPVSRERTIGEMLDLLVWANPGNREHAPGTVHDG